MAPQPTRALVLGALLAACASTRPHGGFASRPEQNEAERRCQAGSPPACGALGRMLVAGPATGKDFERGLVLLEIACGQDDLPTCTFLADLYLQRWDGPRTLARARDLATQACDRRSAEACTTLGVIVRQERVADQSLAWDAYRKGCELGDARGCEFFGLATWDIEPRANRVAAEEALARGCELGRLSSCHSFAMKRFRDPAARGEAASLLMRSCQRGFAQSCASVTFLLAPLVSANADCARVTPLAGKACELNERIGCVVSDACRLGDPHDREPARARLRAACDKEDGLACLYWANAEAAREAPEIERIEHAYDVACEKEGGPVGAVACPRLAGTRLTRATTAAEAEAELARLRRSCDASTAEACCALAEQYRIGKWMPADADKARELRRKACDLGCARCCG